MRAFARKLRLRAQAGRLRIALFNASPFDRRQRVVCLGDSHAEVFGHLQLPGFALDVCMANGATASGVENPNSVSNAGSIFRERLARARASQPVVVLLGEVDCGFVIWYSAQKRDTEVAVELERAVSRYLAFLADIRTRFERVIVVTPPPPTIADGQTWGEVANARREVRATQRARTELTLRFNDALRAGCERIGVGFCDVTARLLDPETGVVAAEFLNPDPLDHHLQWGRYAEVVAAALEPFLSGSAEACRGTHVTIDDEPQQVAVPQQ